MLDMRSLCWCLGLAAWLAMAAASRSQTLAAGEAFLSGSTSCVPAEPDVAALPTGFVAVWEDYGRIFFRRFDRGGAAIGAERVSSAEDAWRTLPAVATAQDGSGAMVWIDVADGVSAQLFSAGGVLGEPVFLRERSGVVVGPGLRPELIRLSDGTFLVAHPYDRYAVRFDGSGVLETIDLRRQGHAVALLEVGGELWHAWAEYGPASKDELTLRRRSLDGAPLAGPQVSTATAGGFTDLELAASAERVVFAWATSDQGVHLQHLDPRGFALTEGVLISQTASPTGPLAMAVDAAGNALVAWQESAPAGSSRLVARSYLADGTATMGAPVLLRTAEPVPAPFASVVLEPAAAFLGAGSAMVVAASPLITCGVCSVADLEAMLAAQHLSGPDCSPEPDRLIATPVDLGGEHYLLLQGGRFQVSAARYPPEGSLAPVVLAHPAAGSEQSGSFWFFDPSNKEIEVKVLDGRAINGHFWVFAAGLTSLPFGVRIVDQETGEDRQFPSDVYETGRVILDTRAFPAD